MLAEFDLRRLGRAAAKFDDAQLRHWQKESVAQLSDADFLAWTKDHLPAGLTQAQLTAFAAAVRHNVEFPSDAKHWGEIVFGTLAPYRDEALQAIRDAGSAFFAAAADVFGQTSDFKQAARQIGQTTNRKGPSLYMPLRAALTGETHGPELGPLLTLITRDEIQARLAAARRAAE
jgi:glutamyl-tRNA synthetase